MRSFLTATLTGTAVVAAAALATGGVLFAHSAHSGSTGTRLAASQATAAGSYPAHYAAPYLQIDNSDAGDMAADMSATGLKYYTLAFLIPQSGCTPQWEDNGEAVGAFTAQINSLKAAGGNVIISSGGESGGELAQTCTSVPSLTAAYANVVNTYGVNRLDFDIEGSTLSDTAANTRRDQALAALQAQDPSVQVDYTLAVAPNGLPSAELGVLKDAKAQGVKVNLVNIMTMDFGNGQNALNDALSAAQATSGQLASLYGISTAQAYAMMGLTPIAGQNDDNEVFSTANASTLESFAASNGVGELSFWEVDGYDKPAGYPYSKIFNAITGGSSSGAGWRQRRRVHFDGRRHHRVRRPVPGRPGRQHGQLQPGPGLHLQRHQRPAVDGGEQRQPADPGQVPGRRRGRHRQRDHRRPVRLQRHRGPGLAAAVQRCAAEPRIR